MLLQYGYRAGSDDFGTVKILLPTTFTTLHRTFVTPYFTEAAFTNTETTTARMLSTCAILFKTNGIYVQTRMSINWFAIGY